MGINGRAVYFIMALTNYGTVPITVNVDFDYEIWVYDDVLQTWGPTTPVLAGVTTMQVVTIQAGETKRIVDPKVALIPPVYTWCRWFVIHDSMHWSYTAFDHVWQGFKGDFTGHSPEEAAYWSDMVHYHPGDIAGKTPAPPAGGYYDSLYPNYLAQSGKCDIQDASLIGAHWQHKIPPLTPDAHPGLSYDIGINDASGNCRRADLNGDLQITIADVSLIAANWQKTWNIGSAPAWPTTGPI